MKYALTFVVLGLLSFGCGARQEAPVDLAAETKEAQKVATQLTTALETEDMNLLSQVMAHDADMVNFGTDAAERWVGWDSLAASAQKQFDSFEDTKLTVHDQVVKVAPSGATAWFSEIVDWDMNAGGKPVQLMGSRITGVLEKRDGKWVFVQFHVSAPVTGQAMPY